MKNELLTPEEEKLVKELDEKIKNAQPRYLEGKKQFLLASNQESLQSLLDNQNAELTRVLIELKSEHDQLNLEISRVQNMIDEYDKRITMLQSADESTKAEEEKQKSYFEFMDKGISAKKERKNEEEFTKKSLLKQKEQLTRDIFVIQKALIHEENESKKLDKKFDRAAINENIIKEKKNKVYSKVEDQKHKNEANQNENDLKIEQYKKIIELKSAFLKFSDERKEIQNQIEQQAKNDSQDKQEVERRKTLKLLMLYNQYLRTLMDEELKENESLEKIFEQIRDITGTENLDQIVDFIILRNKRYNYACYEVRECEEENKDLKKEIKELKKELVGLKNNIILQEKNEGKEIDVDLSTNVEDNKEMISKEREKNNVLLELGKKYNDVDEAYHNVIANISSMIENEKQNPLNVNVTIKNEEPKEVENKDENEEEQKADETKEESQFELTNDELTRIAQVDYERNEREELDKLKLNEEEQSMVKNSELTEKEKKEIEKNELFILDKLIKRLDDPDSFNEKELEILGDIIEFQLTDEEIMNANKVTLREEEEKVAIQKLKSDENNELSASEKKKRIENFKQLKMKYNLYKIQEKKDNTKYKILKAKKNKIDMINDYELLLKKVIKKFETLDVLYNKKNFIDYLMNQKMENQDRSQESKNAKRGIRKLTNRLPTNKRYAKTDNIITEEKNEEEDDKSNLDPDARILKAFLDEQKKEKDNFVSGKEKEKK